MQQGQLSPGDLCENYRVIGLIAAGGMGDVYEAVHEITGKTVAVKCLKLRHRNKEDARARMKMEAVVLSELQHSNLVQVYDAGVTDEGMVWIAMERLHGQTLRELMYRSGPLPVPDAFYYACEIADGVDAVHEVNVIHRDLKPENVFITIGNGVKVLDLGTGKFTGYGLNSTDRMRVVGTTAYMSPEQIKGLRVDARADVYALGLMVYEMLAGRHPLAGADGVAGLPDELERIAIMQLQMTPTPLAELMPGLPAHISSIVSRAIAKNRDDRYGTMNEFCRELRTARKRFIAENRLDDASAELLSRIAGLREKLGAPPRDGAPHGRPRTPAKGIAARKTPAPPADAERGGSFPTDLDDGHENAGFKTDMQTRPPNFTMSGPTPVPAAYQATVELSQDSMAPLDQTVRAPLRAPRPNDIRMHTTNTSPLGVAAVDETLEPLSVPEVAPRRSLRGIWARPVMRRMAVTLGLGALIGVPPALLGVLWTVHHARARVAQVAPAPAEVANVAALPSAAPLDSVAGVAVAVEGAATAGGAPVSAVTDNPPPVASTLTARPPPSGAGASTQIASDVGSSPVGPIGMAPTFQVLPRRLLVAKPTPAEPLVAPDWNVMPRPPAASPEPAKPPPKNPGQSGPLPASGL